jgi:RNA polymerase sigma-70 factor, ECF subfamily
MDGGEQLVARAVAGEPLALERLLLDAYPRLVPRLEQQLPADLRTVVAVDDIIQETFADAFRGIASFKPGGNDAFMAWIGTIADHRLLDAIRTYRAAKRGGGRETGQTPLGARSSIADLVQLMAVTDRTPSRSAGGHEAAAAVQVALAGLKDEYREALRLRFLEALPVADVAARLGRTEASVHKLCSRGLQAMREAMGEATRYLSGA